MSPAAQNQRITSSTKTHKYTDKKSESFARVWAHTWNIRVFSGSQRAPTHPNVLQLNAENMVKHRYEGPYYIGAVH